MLTSNRIDLQEELNVLDEYEKEYGLFISKRKDKSNDDG
jgi:hypothetical protein